jgi:hypothetical protein
LQKLHLETKQEVFSHVNIVFGQKFIRNHKYGYEGQLLQFLAPNLCGFDPGLEAGSSHYIQPGNLSSALVNGFNFTSTTNYWVLPLSKVP